MTQINTKHSGAEWIRASFKVEMSPLGEAVANLLGDLYAGIYHLETKDLKVVDWNNHICIEFVLRYRDLATVDGNELTRLVFLCHDRAIRCSVEATNRGALLLMFHQRLRDGGVWERHPTIEQALEIWRKYHPEKTEA